MKKVIAVAFLLLTPFLGLTQVNAEDRGTIDIHFADIIVPGANTDIVYLYDFVGEKSLVGAETPFLKFKKVLNGWYLTGGWAKSINSNEPDKGVGFLGGHYEAPKLFNDKFSIGVYVGRDWKQKENIAGIKSNIQLW